MDQPVLRVLLVDDDANRSAQTTCALRSTSVPLGITTVADAAGWEQVLAVENWDLIVTEHCLPWIDASAVVSAAKTRWPSCPTIVYTDVNDAERAVSLLKAGLDDYVLRSSQDAMRRLQAGLVSPAPSPDPAGADLRWLEGLPIDALNATLRDLGTDYREHLEPTKDDKRILELIAAAISVEEKRKKTEDVLAQRIEELTGLYEISLEINAKDDLRALLKTVLPRASRLLGAPMAALQLMRPEENRLELVGSYWSDQTDDQHNRLLGTKMEVGEGLTGQVALTGRPMTVNDYQRWQGRASAYEELGLQRVLGVPLKRGGEVIGVLNIADDRKTDPFTESELRLASLFADQVAVGITNAQLLETERQRSEELETLRLASLQLTSSLELQPVLAAILEQSLKIAKADDAHIFLYDGEKLVYGAALWADGRTQTPYTQPRPHGLTATVARSGKQIVVSDTNQHPLYQDWQWGGAIVGLPLRLGQNVRGVMNIAYSQPHNFSENELRLLALLADQAAIAIQNAQLYDQTQRHAPELEERIAERTAELQTANEQLRKLNRVRSEFISNVSHEFRTPLANIMLLARLLGIIGEDERAEILLTLQRETELLTTLIEDLLDLSRLDLERVTLGFGWVDVNVLITNLVADRFGLVTEHGLMLEAQPTPGLPLVLADPKRLLQVITNLLTNAMNYTPRGGRITVRTRRGTHAGQDHVTINISDTGSGIPKDELPHIFERFYRSVSARKGSVPGTGLGLAICDELIQRHGGFITVESEVGVGSKFTVWLPVADSSSTAPD